jgi:cell division inhibitor SepF
MADRLKRAAAWLGLVTDDRYPEYDDTEPTEGVDRAELLGEAEKQRPSASRPASKSAAASVTPLETKRGSELSSRQPVMASGRTATAAAPAAVIAEDQPPQTESYQERADLTRIVTVHPRTFNDARTIGEHFRDGVPVIMNLTQMENADAKRLVDFAAGLILGLRGNIERVTSKVFLLSPQNVTVTAEEKERIAGGFFNQS